MAFVRCLSLVLVIALLSTSQTYAEEYHLLTGVNAAPTPGHSGYWPAPGREVSPYPATCCPNDFYDGQRLAGTTPAGPVVDLRASGTPFYWPNEFGSLSFTFRRGSVPAGSLQVPLQGIDFLGGPLLDLDGDLNNGERKLIPVLGQSPAEIPNSESLIEVVIDVDSGTIELLRFDVTGTNEGGPGISADTCVTLTTLAGTSTNGLPGEPINPSIDTRTGTLTPYTGASGQLRSVQKIENLGFEFWQDTLLASSSTASTLGTFQFMGTFRGWRVERDPSTGQFPTLAGEGLGTTLWPMVDTTGLEVTFDTANGLQGGSATILSGYPGDDFSVTGNGGLPLTSFGGDIGAYFDSVVIPLIKPDNDAFIYLESAGFGINNSNDPIYVDSISYDVVIIAEELPVISGDCDNDGDVDLFDFGCFQICFAGGELAEPECDEVFDFDLDDDVDLTDFASLEELLAGAA